MPGKAVRVAVRIEAKCTDCDFFTMIVPITQGTNHARLKGHRVIFSGEAVPLERKEQ